MKDENDFSYTYYAPSEEEKKEIESIRKEYLPKNLTMSKMDELRALNDKVKTLPMILSLTIGIVGILIFGLGLTMVLEWQLYVFGIIVAVVGCVPMVINYSLYQYMIRRRKEKYKDRILALSEELLNEKEEK